MNDPARGIYVLSVTSFHSSPVGGGILIGTDTRAGKSRRARISVGIVTRPPRAGESWRVSGHWIKDELHGWEIEAEKALPVVPTGEAIMRWIASSEALPGIGRATARRLWAALGSDLYRALREGDASVIAPVTGPSAAIAMVAEFRLLTGEIEVFEWFDLHGLDPRVAVAAAGLWGTEAIERLEANPYCLSLLESWKRVDDRARALGIAQDDERRLVAAVNEAVARRYKGHGRGAGGHMSATRQQLISIVRQLLGHATADLADDAVTLAMDRGELIEHAGQLQGRGPYLMERQVERSIGERLAGSTRSLDAAAAIAGVEEELGLRFDAAQIEAVTTATESRFAVIDGAAGTGKSMVTRAILRAAQRAGRSFIQVALSGRAAKRLREATGYEALTIHRFLKGVTNGNIRLEPGKLLIDEASMVSTPDLWQILNSALPTTDVLLVGDPGQLPPINAGNPLAALVASTDIPRVTLTRIHRQSGRSAIPVVAASIRSGVLPHLPFFDLSCSDDEGVLLLPTELDDVPGRTVDVFEAFVGPPAERPCREAVRRLHAARVQILGSTVLGPVGVRAISDRVEARWMTAQPQVPGWGLGEGSKILWTRNSYGHDTGVSDGGGGNVVADIMNGSLGIIQRATDEGAVTIFDDETSTRALVRARDLERVQRGWAITVHKAQGSAFETVIMPVVRSRLLDRQLLYTAITRATTRVVLVGDPALLQAAVEKPPSGSARQQGLFSSRNDERRRTG